MMKNRQKKSNEPLGSINVKSYFERYLVEYKKYIILSTVKLSYDVLFYINERRSPFDNGKNPGNQLISDDIDNRHFGFSFSQPPMVNVRNTTNDE